MSGSFKYYLLAVRPKTLPAAAAPVILGLALAVDTGHFRLVPALATLCAALLIQIGTNYANDLFDYLKGTDTDDRIGPTRVTQAGLLSEKQVRNATIIIFSAALLLGAYLAWLGGWPIIIIGLTSILFGILYTGGPFPLGYLGLGDLFVFIYFGLIAVAGTYYLQTGTVSEASLLLGAAAGALSTAILTANNLRDIRTDKDTGKRTLAVRFGATFTRLEYTAMILLAYLVPVVLYLFWKSNLTLFLPVFSLPPAIRCLIDVWSLEGGDLNPLLGQTGRLLMLYSLMLALGFIL